MRLQETKRNPFVRCRDCVHAGPAHGEPPVVRCKEKGNIGKVANCKRLCAKFYPK